MDDRDGQLIGTAIVDRPVALGQPYHGHAAIVAI